MCCAKKLLLGCAQATPHTPYKTGQEDHLTDWSENVQQELDWEFVSSQVRGEAVPIMKSIAESFREATATSSDEPSQATIPTGE